MDKITIDRIKRLYKAPNTPTFLLLKKRFIYVKEYIDTTKVTIPMRRRKKADKLSILNLKLIKGMLLFKLKEIFRSSAEYSLYTMDKLSKIPAAIEKMLEVKFEILGFEYVANEESDPVIYNATHIMKLVVK